MTTPVASPLRPRLSALLLPLALPTVCLLWAFGPTLADLAQTWNTNPQYSHGFLVPVFALGLLYLRRERLAVNELRPNLLGLGLLGAGLLLRLVGAFYFFVWLDPISLIPCVAGLTLLLGGMAAWRWAWPSVLFLSFMIPLPYRVANALSGPLQRLATITSTFVMQVLGMPALAEGNVILLNEHEIGIVEACSGLRMLVVFFALSTAVVLVIRRHWIDRAVIILSAIPIALVSNIFRVTATGMMYEAGYSEFANAFFHDVAGWLMMPLALGLLGLELKLLSALFIDAPAPVPRSTREPSVARRAQAPATPRTATPRTAPATRRVPGQAVPRSTRQAQREVAREQEQPIPALHPSNGSNEQDADNR